MPSVDAHLEPARVPGRGARPDPRRHRRVHHGVRVPWLAEGVDELVVRGLDAEPRHMRTCVRVRRGDHPACRPRRLLRLRRAAGRSSPARPPRDRRGGSRAGSQLRGEGVRGPHGHGWRAGPGAVSECRRGGAPHVRVLGGERGRVRGVQPHDPAGRGPVDRRGVPRRGRAATAVRRSDRNRRTARRDVREQVGLPITVGVARTKFLAKVASAVGKPDGLLVVPPGRELAFLHPLPVERLWGWGPSPPRSFTAADHQRRRGVRARRGRAGRHVGQGGRPASPRARAQPRPAPRTDRAPPPLDRLAARARAGTEIVRRHRRRRRCARRPRHRADARRRTCRPDRHVAVAVRRLLTRDPVAHLAQATSQTRQILDAVREPGDSPPMIDGQGSRSSASRSATCTTARPCSSRCRSTAPRRCRRSRCRRRRGTRPVRVDGPHPGSAPRSPPPSVGPPPPRLRPRRPLSSAGLSA